MEIFTVAEFKAKVTFAHPFNWVIKQRDKQTISYLADFMTFDTEFTTIISDLDENRVDAKGLLYLWQACVCGIVVMGRDMAEFKELCDHLKKTFGLRYNKRIASYVHNLECDYMFLQGYWKKWTVFATAKRAVLTAYADGIEFRCSYKLTNMSLAKFLEAEGVEHKKAKEYDYKKLRTPKTPLEPHEVYYAYCDVKGLYEALKHKMDREGDNIATIPLTSTGYVRRDCRKAMRENEYNWYNFQRLKLNPECYILMKKAFRGGNTHANRFLAGGIVEDLYSFDIASSYPSVMLYEKYPMGTIVKGQQKSLRSLDKLKKDGYGYCVEISFKDLRTFEYIPYIPIDKCVFGKIDQYKKGLTVNDNGRLLETSGWTTLRLVDVDLDIIRKTYKWKGSPKIHTCYYYKMKPLPKEFRQAISDYFVKKTTLKGVTGQEYYYMKNKNLLNSTYGMTVTDMVHEIIKLVRNEKGEGKWEQGTKTDAYIEEQLGKFYNSRNNFLAYQWGVYVTAYARKRLQDAIDICKQYIVYCDTDSVKFIANDDIAAKLMEINEGIKQKAAASDVQAIAYTIRNEEQVLGVWDKEHDYKEFITYGAKKYADTYICKKYGSKDCAKCKQYCSAGYVFEITVSGLAKKAAREIGSIRNFKPGLVIHDSGRTIACYDDLLEPHMITVEGEEFEIRGNMGIVETTYTLGMTPEYKDILSQARQFNQNNACVSSVMYDPD